MNAHMILKAALLIGFSLLVLTMMSPIETSQANYPTVGLAAPECPPQIDISKQEEGTDSRDFPWGADVPFEITVTNTGNVDLINVAVTDPLVADCDRQIGPLAVGGFYPYTCEAPDVTMDFTNIAYVKGEANGMTVYDEDTSSVTVKPCDPQIDIRKQEEGPDSRDFPWGADVPFEITVTNTGNVDLSNVVVTDSLVAACNLTIGTLAVGEDHPYECEWLNVPVGTFTNIASVQGESNCGPVNDEDPSSVTIEPSTPAIDISKQEEGPDFRTFEVPPGGSVDVPFTITVTNTGSVDLSDVEVTDSLWANCSRQIGTLAVEENYSYTCEATKVTKGVYTNIASVQGEANGMTVYDEDPSEVTVNELTIDPYYDITVAFEDAKVNDYDYNDWVVEIDTETVFDVSARLKEIQFTMTPKARGAWLGHDFHIRFDGDTFMSDGVAELIIQDESGSTIRRDPPQTFFASAGKDFTINFDETKEHNCTCEAFADHTRREHNFRKTDESKAEFNTPARIKAVLTITFDTPSVFKPPPYGPYCQNLFFDPYLHVKGEEDHYDISWTKEDTKNLILCVVKPLPSELEPPNWWWWPEEQKRIDTVYTRVRWDDDTKSFEFPLGWEACHNTCVFDGDKCDMRPCENVNSILYLPLMIRSQP